MTPFSHRDQLTSLSPEQLDAYWAHGWFRMRQNVFTTHFLEFADRFHSALWLRVDLAAWSGDRKFAELAKRNKAFRVEFAVADSKATSGAHEALFQRYRHGLEFEVSPTLQSLLFGRHRSSRFQTQEINLYDGDKLIAAGVFDLGKDSAAGITSFYDPDYRKYSLGKYFIYCKMQWCRGFGLQWFYPGYFAPGHARFDYKIEMATEALQYLALSTGEWRHFSADFEDPLAEMTAKLASLALDLQKHGNEVQLVYYRHLDANLHPQLAGMDLFDMPVFLQLLPLVVTYDPRSNLFEIDYCRSVYQFEDSGSNPDIWDSHLLAVDQVLFSSPLADEVVALVESGILARR